MIKEIAFGIIICLLFISLVIIFCAVIIKLYIKKIKEHNIKEIEFQKTLNLSIIETQEQVFENISQDLHDDIGQQLTFVNFQLEKIKLDATNQLDDLEKLTNSVSKVSQSIRDLSHSMNNQLVVTNDLIKAIQNELSRIKKYKTIDVDFEYYASEKQFSDTEKIIIFRIFQETISNCIKHSKASKITIKIDFFPNFNMEINDNGIGFDTQNCNKESIGLSNIYKRAKIINYQLTLTSIVNKGTKLVLCQTPIKNERN